MKFKNDSFFWPSYVDILTGLFIVILVLFVLTFKTLSDSKRVAEGKLFKIQEIQNAVKSLPVEYFEYQTKFKRFTLRKQIQFKNGESIISPNDFSYLINVGKGITNMINELKIKYAQDSIKYMIIIEGMASKIGGSDDFNYTLSYNRAKAVHDFWRAQNIIFDPSICEIMISGNGISGIGRYQGREEKKNQRILIQIIPKINYQGNLTINNHN